MRHLVFTVFFLAGISVLAPVQAAEYLHFKTDWHRPALIPLQTALKTHYLDADGIRLATIDLNDDGVPEYIAAPAKDTCSGQCRYVILALEDGKAVELGSFEGFQILLADKSRYGVREILVYTNPLNDYDVTRYVWNPKERGFQPESNAKVMR